MIDQSYASSNSAVWIYCDGGLANRVNCLVNGLIIARKFDTNYHIFWPINRYCRAGFDDLFNYPFQTIDKGKDEIRKFVRLGIVADHNFICSPDNLWVNPRVTNIFSSTSKRIHDLFKLVDKVVVFSPMPIYEFGSEFKDVLREIFIPKAELISNTTYELDRMKLKEPYWGLHMRGSDAKKSEKYYHFYRILIRFLPGQIYLATDDSELIYFFESNRNLIKRDCGVRVAKADDFAGWNASIRDDNDEVMPYNVTRSIGNVRDAIIDLLLLSKSRLIPTSSSTYLELAANISSKKISLVRLIFYSRYLFRILLHSVIYQFNKKTISK